MLNLIIQSLVKLYFFVNFRLSNFFLRHILPRLVFIEKDFLENELTKKFLFVDFLLKLFLKKEKNNVQLISRNIYLFYFTQKTAYSKKIIKS